MLKVLVTGDGLTAEHQEAIYKAGASVHLITNSVEADLCRAVVDTDIYLLGGDEYLGEEILAHANRLRMISLVGTGIGSFVDEIAAKRRGIELANTPGVMAGAVAEHTVGMMICLQRHILAQSCAVRSGRSYDLPSSELSTCHVGLVGLGAVGERVARMLRYAFGPKISYYSRTRKARLEEELNIHFLPLKDIFSNCDIVCLLLPTNSETRQIVDASLLSVVKNGSILINTAGASLIDPLALRDALEQGPLSCVGMDGYFTEPLPHPEKDEHQLLRLPQDIFLVTPHRAAKTTEAWPAMFGAAVNNVVNFLRKR